MVMLNLLLFNVGRHRIGIPQELVGSVFLLDRCSVSKRKSMLAVARGQAVKGFICLVDRLIYGGKGNKDNHARYGVEVKSDSLTFVLGVDSVMKNESIKVSRCLFKQNREAVVGHGFDSKDRAVLLYSPSLLIKLMKSEVRC